MATIDGRITPSRSSDEDIEAGVVHVQEDQAKPGKGEENNEDLPEYQDGVPPPPYTASMIPVSPEEQPRGIRAWFNRHRVLTSWLLGLFSLCILGGLITGIMMAAIFVPCGTDCGKPVYYRADMCPLAREDLLRTEVSSSTVQLPQPTGFAEGDRHRLVYTNIGGQRPVVGSAFTAVIQPRYADGEDSHRIFYHDTTGQIYETAITSTNRSYTETRDVYEIRGAVMAVNTSLAAAVAARSVNGVLYNTTVLYFHPANDTHIARVLSDSPGTYGGVGLSPFRSFSTSLAATAIGPRILLAYRDETYTAVGNGWWNETDQSDAARHVRNIHIEGAAPDSHLSIVTAPTNFIREGFVLAYQRAVDAKLETVFQYGNVSEVHKRVEPARFTLPHVATSWPALDLMRPSLNIGPNHFSIAQLRGGNLTYETYLLGTMGGMDGGPRPVTLKISHDVLRRKYQEQAYYCVFGDQPIAKASHYTEWDRQPPMWDIIPYSPLKGVHSSSGQWWNSFSWLYMLRKPDDETQGARLSRFTNYDGGHSSPVFKDDVPLFSGVNGTTPVTIVATATATNKLVEK